MGKKKKRKKNLVKTYSVMHWCNKELCDTAHALIKFLYIESRAHDMHVVSFGWIGSRTRHACCSARMLHACHVHEIHPNEIDISFGWISHTWLVLVNLVMCVSKWNWRIQKLLSLELLVAWLHGLYFQWRHTRYGLSNKNLPSRSCIHVQNI